MKIRNRLWAFGIKLSTTPERHDLEKLSRDARLVKADNIVLLSRAWDEIDGGSTLSTHLPGILERLKNL